VRLGLGWRLPDCKATAEAVFWGRRQFLEMTVAASVSVMPMPAMAELVAGASPPPAPRNSRYHLDQPLTEEKHVTSYNNFYEFNSGREHDPDASSLKIRPWTVVIDGLVEREECLGIDDLLGKVHVEERLYRHRCVEGWTMAVPWIGFPLKSLVEIAQPLGSAKFLRMESFLDPQMAPGQRQFWYPWPYVEALSISEAVNELAFLVTGAYGKPLPFQNGAPLRLALPWKYGFKSIKSIVRFTFTDKRPVTFWERQEPQAYGFWANVNPDVPHPRWSQAFERVLGTDERRPTRIWNGYGEFVADLYASLEGEHLFR
jgi:methionine sulfoxide reductase catalytic subunit